MNPYASSEPGFTPDPNSNDASVNYLRRLKAQVDGDAAIKPIAAPGPVLPRERRRSPRFQCKGSVSITADSSQVRMWGTVTDISLRGCYVEMSSTLPVDAKVSLTLDISGIRIRAKGIVRISYPGLGMGILMTELLSEQREFLDQLLATLAQSAAVTSPEQIQERAATEALARVDTVVFVSELRRFFAGKAMLSREEFIRIAERCQQT